MTTNGVKRYSAEELKRLSEWEELRWSGDEDDASLYKDVIAALAQAAEDASRLEQIEKWAGPVSHPDSPGYEYAREVVRALLSSSAGRREETEGR